MGWFTTRVWFKVIVSFTLTLGWKNEKQPCGPIELDLEANNLVKLSKQLVHMYMCYMAGGGVLYNF